MKEIINLSGLQHRTLVSPLHPTAGTTGHLGKTTVVCNSHSFEHYYLLVATVANLRELYHSVLRRVSPILTH